WRWNFRWIFLDELQNVSCYTSRNIGNRHIVWRAFKRILSRQTYAKHGVEHPNDNYGEWNIEPNEIFTNHWIRFGNLGAHSCKRRDERHRQQPHENMYKVIADAAILLGVGE